MHLDFLFLVYDNVHNNLILMLRVILLVNEDFRIFEALVVKIAFNKRFSTVHDVRRNLSTLHHADSLFQILAFGLLDAGITDIRHTGTHGQMDGQPHLSVFLFVIRDAHVREEPVPPIALTSLRDFITRNRDGLPFGQTGETDNDIIFIIISTLHLDIGNLQLLRRVGIEDYRCFYIHTVGRHFLCDTLHRTGKQAEHRYE